MKKKLKNRMSGWLQSLPAGSTLGGRGVDLLLPRGWPESDTSVYWWTRTGDGGNVTAGREENLKQLPSAVRAASLHVWTPPGETLLTSATLPTRSRARILQALPYALEDQLLDEPEHLHFAYTREDDGRLAVAVTRRARLNLWIENLKAAGIRAASACPANLALPLYPEGWSAAFMNDEIWVRTGTHAGFICIASTTPPPLLRTAIKEAIAQGAAPQRLVVFSIPDGFDAEAWSRELEIPVMAEASDFWRYARPPALNILQSDYSHASHVGQLLKPLRPAFIMLAVWIVAIGGMDLAEWIRLRQQHGQTTAEMRTIFQKSFPEVKTVLDPAAQMQKQIDALQSKGGGPADLLPLLSRVAPALQTHQARAKLNGIKYNERTLTLELVLPDYQALDAVKNTLQAANLDVEVVAANGRGNEVDGRLRVQPGGSKAKSASKRS